MTFKLFGFPVTIETGAFLLIAVLFLFGLYLDYTMLDTVLGIGIVVVSLMVHELGHAFAARYFGSKRIEISLHQMGGQTRRDRTTKHWYQELSINVAGVSAGFAIALLCYVAIVPLPLGEVTDSRLGLVFRLNVAWGIFNMLPIFPLDGGQALGNVLSAVLNPLHAAVGAHSVGLVLAVSLGAFVIWLNGLTISSLYIAMLAGMFARQNWMALQGIQALRKQPRDAA
jgi:Zn-dependent protease